MHRGNLPRPIRLLWEEEQWVYGCRQSTRDVIARNVIISYRQFRHARNSDEWEEIVDKPILIFFLNSTMYIFQDLYYNPWGPENDVSEDLESRGLGRRIINKNFRDKEENRMVSCRSLFFSLEKNSITIDGIWWGPNQPWADCISFIAKNIWIINRLLER